ncbi:MAG TPA: CoA-binding protein [Candidatus Dormibacteraeota bacterium]|nr:CoA-binding protein [Candidatus Dormibacteraeota bacterium]
MKLETALKRRALLDRAKRVAMVGASANPLRPSYFVLRYLQTHGYDVAPINPAYEEIDGTRCYPSLEAYARERGAPDVVDVFRKPEECPRVVREAIAAGAKAIWFQYGVINDEAIRLADQAGLDVVVDRCMKVEHARFDGGLSLAGFDSGVLSSKRRRRAG